LKAGFSIEYLADNLKAIDACAAWDFGQWDVQKKGASLDGAVKALARSARKDGLPLSVVAMNEKTALPIAMATLRDKDGSEWPKVSPWVVSVYVHERFRGQGIARSLVARIEGEARRLGYGALYLQADEVADMYLALGYEVIDKVETKLSSCGTRTLFKKDLV
jgi:GNAT superfamily N-acetyltransferase